MAATQSALGGDNVTGGLVSHWFMLRKAIGNVRDTVTIYIRGKKLKYKLMRKT